LTSIGTGVLVLGNAANTFTGGVSVNSSGEVSVATDSALGDPSNALTFNGGGLVATANMATARTITLNSGGGQFTPNSGVTLTINTNISGAGLLIQNGNGTVVLNGTNTYAGGTRMDRGVLKISADNNLGAASTPILFNGGTLAVTTSFATARGHA
jgi:autotransporter-associated beta strand protein